METAFDKVRQGKAESSPELIALALKARDHIQILIEHPEEADHQAGEAILAGFRDLNSDAHGRSSRRRPCPRRPPRRGERTWHVRMRLARDVMANGTNPILLLDELRSLGTATITALTDEIPPLQELDPAACYVGWDILLTSL